jgi:peptide alpha-N-acetyltransferase
LLHVAENADGKIIGYVLAKLYFIFINHREEDEDNPKLIHGHITSISILRTYRKLGVATKLMQNARIYNLIM